MIVWRVLVADLFPQSKSHLEGLDEFLSARDLRCQRLAPHNLAYLLNRHITFGPNDDLEACVRTTCQELDAIIEQEINIVSTVFTVRSRITAPDLSSFIALLQAEEYKFAEGNVHDLNWFHHENLRLVDTERAGRFTASQRPEIGGLLAAAVNAYSPAATLAAYVRVFEAAFRLPHNQLKKPLHRFLASGRLGIAKKFSDEWIELRHKMVHADRTGNAGFDGEAYPHLEFIKQAAYDVAFNKRTWNSPDAERSDSGCLATIVIPGPKISNSVGVFCCIDMVKSEALGRYPKSTYKEGGSFNWGNFLKGLDEVSLKDCYGVYNVFGLKLKADFFVEKG